MVPLNLSRATWDDLLPWVPTSGLERLQGLTWLAYKAPGFLSLFVQGGGEWESHWWSSASAFRSLTACRESIKMFFKDTGAQHVWGLTELENKKGLKMARLLGYKPLGFKMTLEGKPALLGIKENLNG